MKKANAVKLAGSAYKLAQILGLTRQAVSKWKEDLPPLQVYRLKDLRPEWFTKEKK